MTLTTVAIFAVVAWTTVTVLFTARFLMLDARYRRMHGPRYVARALTARGIVRALTALTYTHTASLVAVTGVYITGNQGVQTAMFTLLCTSAVYGFIQYRWLRERDRVERRIGLEALGQ